MASRTRTLQQLLDGVADRADVAISASGVRHTNAKVTARVNRSIQKWKLLVASAGDDTNLLTVRKTTSASTTVDAANWAPNQYITQPDSMMLIRGLDVWISDSPFEMLPIDEMERNDTGTGTPVFYRIGGTNAAGAELIQLFPNADGIYSIDVRYIPAHVDLSATTDLSTAVEFTCGGEDWVEIDSAMETLRNDGLSVTAEYQSMRVDRADVERRMAFTLACRGSIRKVDTRERRRMLQAIAVSPWRVVVP